MKTTIRRVFAATLLLSTQIFAQRFISAIPDAIQVGFIRNSEDKEGFLPNGYQTAVLGKKNSVYGNLMLLRGLDTIYAQPWEWEKRYKEVVGSYNVVNSYGDVLGVVRPLVAANIYKTSKGDSVFDGISSGVVVLDSMSNTKNSAIVVFATLRKITVVKIEIKGSSISQTILNSFNLREEEFATNGDYYSIKYYRRLTLLGESQNSNGRVFHLATGNLLSPNETYANAGRIDFFSIVENSWTKSQPNLTGIKSGINGLFFENDTRFGKDLVSAGDIDGNGYNDLAVIAPKSPQHPQSAIYIFFMDNEYTPSKKEPIVLSGNSLPWKKSAEEYALTEKGLNDFNQDCIGISSAYLGEEIHLLVSCNIKANFANSKDSIAGSIIIKDLVLNNEGYISKSTTIFAKNSGWHALTNAFSIESNPLPIKNHKNNLDAISFLVNGPVSYAARNILYSTPILDADFSKNFSIEAGKSESILNIDSLFYRSGTSGFSAQTIFGLAKCTVENSNLNCEGGENAIGSWSAVELVSKSACDSYMPCKRKDTVYIYTRSQTEPQNTALRISKSVVIPSQLGLFTWENINSLTYFRNPNLQNSGLSLNTANLKLSMISNGENNISIMPISQNGGIDTLFFGLSLSSNTYNYRVLLHIADTSKIQKNSLAQTPSEIDTLWNTAAKKYFALPLSNSNGNIYTYDIAQNGLGDYAEIVGNYLRILNVDFAEVSLAYTENGLLKTRKILLTPESKSVPESSSSSGGANSEFDGNSIGEQIPSAILRELLPLQEIPADAVVSIHDLKGNKVGSVSRAGVYIIQVKSRSFNMRKVVVVK
ncbi:hypothetical protein AGMMS49938_15220 [Fibrobacterales bacterium]|nr:hypothetical protein AGMMS49938_15220 [Fibrobacterales bacterium]